jgi:hypothetical protein
MITVRNEKKLIYIITKILLADTFDLRLDY